MPRLGLGRAVVHLDENDAAPYRDDLLHACLHLSEIAYDPQIEGPRGHYLVDLIQRTGEERFFRAQILDALTTTQDTYDLNQLFQIAGILAARGDAEARRLMYVRHGSLSSDDDIHFYADEMLDLDGEAGFLFVLDRIGSLLRHDSEFWQSDSLLGLARDRFGEEAVQRLIEDASATNSNVRAYVEEARRYRARLSVSHPVHAAYLSLSYAELLEAKSQPERRLPKGPGVFSHWGTRASDDDILRVANDLLECDDDDPELLWRIQVFGRRAFPLAPDRLISLALAADWSNVVDVWTAPFPVKISHHSLKALQRMTHPLVRAFGFQLLNAQHLQSYALGMFVNNFEIGDSTVFNEFIARDRPDHELHAAFMAVQDIYQHTPLPELAGTFVLLYDRNPCSHCRTWIVETLIELDALPVGLAHECMYDAVPETREVARKYLARTNQTPLSQNWERGSGGEGF